jgi:hypothetical protein
MLLWQRIVVAAEAAILLPLAVITARDPGTSSRQPGRGHTEPSAATTTLTSTTTTGRPATAPVSTPSALSHLAG